MVGRDRELARVMLLLEDALAGGGRLVLCTGEAGIGGRAGGVGPGG
jgi:predicted ATPase